MRLSDDGPEPAVGPQLLTLTGAALGLLVAFGVPITEAQRSAVLALLAAGVGLAAVAGGWWTRRRVTPSEAPRDLDGTPLVRTDGLPAGDGGRYSAPD